MEHTVYLDNNATTMVAPEVLEAMLPYFSERYGNPSSLHSFGGNVAREIEQARAKVADLIGAHPEEIVFTGCGTESDSTAIRSALDQFPDKRHIITSAVEHPAILGLCGHLQKRGYQVTYLQIDETGQIDLEELRATITDNTAIVSIMHANNESGIVFPIHDIAEIVKEKGCLFHTDAVQSAGKLPLDMARTPVDFLSMSGHKLHAPKGIGGLFVRRGTPYTPLLIGGHQESDKRAGTENVTAMIGFGKAAELAAADLPREGFQLQAMRDRLQDGLLTRCKDVLVNGSASPRLPNTLSVSFGYVEGESIVLLLDEQGICVSTGSACSSGSLDISHVVKCLGVPSTHAHGTIRFSLSRYTTDDEIDYALEHTERIIERLRALSPFGRD